MVNILYFQASRYKERNILKLNNNDYQSIYSKNGAWLKYTTYLFIIPEPWIYSQRFRSDLEV